MLKLEFQGAEMNSIGLRRLRSGVAIGCALALCASRAAAQGAPSASKCEIGLIAELPVKFEHNQPTLEGEINGRKVSVLIDTGADMGMLLRSAAVRLGLRPQDLRGDIYGAGGRSQAQFATIQSFKLAGHVDRNIHLLIGGEQDIGADVLLSEHELREMDVEFDLAHRVVRLLRFKNCADTEMPYWATGSFSEAPFTSSSADGDERIVLRVKLNGQAMSAYLDSGAMVSMASLAAAQHARVAISDTGRSFGGIGGALTPEHSGVVASFQVGDEIIHNAKLSFGNIFGNVAYDRIGSRIPESPTGLPSMLLGADFLNAHRVLISHARHVVYFTYNGGPVFAVPAAPAAEKPSAASPAASHTGG